MSEEWKGNTGPKTGATGRQAVCASQHPIITEIMLAVLQEGGNAIDAAMAGAISQATVQQDMTNHTGTVTALIYEASTGKIHQLNSTGTLVPGMALCQPIAVGSAYYAREYSPSACIPGFMPGMKTLHERFGSKPWAYLVEPAIACAEDGYVVNPFQHTVWAQTGDIYLHTESGRRWLAPDGFMPETGDRFRNPELAETLRRLAAEGPDYFITGGWAQHFLERAHELGWMITPEHLSATPPRWQEPVRYRHGGYEIVQQAAPERQGVFSAIVLGILEQLDIASLGHYSASAEALYYMAHALRRAEFECGLLNDPEIFDAPTDVWLSPEFHRLLADILAGSKAKVDLTEHFKFAAGPHAVRRAGIKLPAAPGHNVSAAGSTAGGADKPEQPAGSCELSVVDGQGNWVQLMNTLQSGGIPGEVVDGVCMVGSHARPGRMDAGIMGWLAGGGRIRCVIGNTLVLKDGVPWLGLGTPGNVHCTIPQVLSNILDYGMEPYAAIDAPRMLPLSGDYTLGIESRIPADVAAGLARLGVLVNRHPAYDYHMGSYQVSWRDSAGMLHSTSDPRHAGSAAGF